MKNRNSQSDSKDREIYCDLLKISIDHKVTKAVVLVLHFYVIDIQNEKSAGGRNTNQ